MWQHGQKANDGVRQGLMVVWRPLERHRMMWGTDYQGHTSDIDGIFCRERPRYGEIAVNSYKLWAKKREIWPAMEQPGTVLLSALAFA